MVLIQGVLERTVAGRSTGLLVVGVRVVVIHICVLLLAVDSPDRDCDAAEQDGTTYTADDAADCLFGCAAQA